MFVKSIMKKLLKPVMPCIRNAFLWDIRCYRLLLKEKRKQNINRKQANRFVFYRKDRNKQFCFLFKRIKIFIRRNSRFQYWIDENLHFVNRMEITDALPPNYELILQRSLYDLLERNAGKNNAVEKSNYALLIGLKLYIKRVIDSFPLSNDNRLQKSKEYFERMFSKKAESLEEALQRILFWSSLFWQSGHMHVGLGRLDKMLASFATDMSESEITCILEDFLSELHRYYSLKSCGLMGDTGQLVILGGTEVDGSYFCNKLTYCFIAAMKGLKLPDPKLLLRVNSKMPKDLLELATECNATGIGCPLLSNDDVVIPALEKFGYSHEDACNYVTSACWEPFCYGKALGRGNLQHINYAKAMENAYSDSSFKDRKSFDEVLSLYLEKLRCEVQLKLSEIDFIRWEKDPLLTLFMEECLENGKDVGEGGAVYNDYGILSVGLANTVNSLLNIKYLVFEEKKYTLEELKSAAESDFSEAELLRNELFDNAYFGHEDEDVLFLISKITGTVDEICAGYRNYLGGKVKFGFSSPAYMECGADTGATLDGRHDKQPLSVHISAKLGEPYSELMNFAGKLDYSARRCNGNVVDFFVSPDFIQNNFDKFCSFLKSSINVGFFQLQMNVVSSETLIAAKKNPDLFPNLVVRVWGFSAYFKDLPESYQNLLIERALESEKSA